MRGGAVIAASLMFGACLHPGFGAETSLVCTASGRVIKGRVLGSTATGLRIETSRGPLEIPWYTLSPATRYRYDERFRNAFRQILRGQPIGARAGQPSARSKSAGKKKPGGRSRGSETAPVPAGEAVEADTASGMLMKYLTYREVPLVSVADIPAELPAGGVTRCWALQFGPESSNVLYLVMVEDASGGWPRALVAYAPGVPELDPPKNLHGMRKTTERGREMNYPAVKLEAFFGKLRAQYSIRLQARLGAEVQWICRVDTALRTGNLLSRFRLERECKPVTATGRCPVDILLDRPLMVLRTSTGRNRVVATGDVRMGRFRLVPGRGMADAVELSVKNTASGEVLQQQEAELQERDISERYLFRSELPKPPAGQVWLVEARLDLGPILGDVYATARIRGKAR